MAGGELGRKPKTPVIMRVLNTKHAGVAQLVEHSLGKTGVIGSNPIISSTQTPDRKEEQTMDENDDSHDIHGAVAQLVAQHIVNVKVAGSIPVCSAIWGVSSVG